LSNLRGDLISFLDQRKSFLFGFSIIFFTFLVFVDLVGGKWASLENSLANLSTFFYQSLWPPDWRVIEARDYPVCRSSIEITCSTAYIGVAETLKMAFVSTVLGFLFSFPLAVLSSRNLYSDKVAIPTRMLLAAIRTIPSLIWAILFVIMVGLGPVPGVLAMTFYTIGYIGKLQYEAIEGLSSSPLDAARAMGLGNIEIVERVVIPESANNLISQCLFMFEYNVRQGSIVGIVGAGGLGTELFFYYDAQMYQRVMSLLIVLFCVVVIIDLLSIKARSYFVEDSNFQRPYLFGNLFKSK
tara:strand:+ start:5711 stop:6604 length:894 start_codon:yes stop_codon:yes gene_type:complete